MNQPQRIVIATRESRLALWQAEHVQSRLQALYPACRVELLGMTTRGDQILDRPLAKVGGKGLFVKELETALLDRRADIAVHSMKDVPMTLAPEFALVAIAEREVPLDAFVSNKYESLDDMPPGAVVGTSSLRREAQLRARHPNLKVQPLRGNLDTRRREHVIGSPLYWVTPQAPPTLCIHGTKDEYVAHEQAGWAFCTVPGAVVPDRPPIDYRPGWRGWAGAVSGWRCWVRC